MTASGASIDGLIELFATLGGLLAEETAAVRARDYGRLKSLCERKGRLAEAYGAQLQELGESRAGALEPGAARLRASARELLAVLESNARILNAAKVAHERLIKAIGEAVAAKARPAGGYSRSGAYGSAGPRATVPIALNQSI